MNTKISLLKYIDSYGIKKKHVIPETCSELSALPGQAAGTPVFRRCLVFVALSPPPWGGTSEPRYERMHKTPAKRPLMNKNVTTMDDSI